MRIRTTITSFLRHRRWLIAVCLLGLAGVGWWWTQHRPLRTIATFTDFEDSTTCDTGFLLRDKHYRYTFYDWDGRKQWQVQAEMPVWTGWLRPPHLSGGIQTRLSRQGRLYLARTVGHTIHVACWYRGQQEWLARVPVKPVAYRYKGSLPANGTSWLLYGGGSQGVFLSLRHRIGREKHTQKLLLITHSVAYPLPTMHQHEYWRCSEDGTTLVHTNRDTKQRTIYTWHHDAHGIHWQKRYAFSVAVSRRILARSILANGSTIYGGQYTTGDGKAHLLPKGYTLCEETFRNDGPLLGLQNVDESRYAVYDPATHHTWSFPTKNSTDDTFHDGYYTMSGDGRYVLFTYTAVPREKMRMIFERLPWGELLANQQIVEIYERPGRRRLRTTLRALSLRYGMHVGSVFPITSSGHFLIAGNEPEPSYRFKLVLVGL